MRKRFVPREITIQEERKIKKLIAEAAWTKTSSPRYDDCPHRYIIKFKTNIGSEAWDWFAQVIKECGAYRGWRGTRYKYLVIGRECFWVDWPALNRTQANVLDPL